MADAEHSKCFVERRVGSSPTLGTNEKGRTLRFVLFRYSISCELGRQFGALAMS